jgi:hypothetical protein
MTGRRPSPPDRGVADGERAASDGTRTFGLDGGRKYGKTIMKSLLEFEGIVIVLGKPFKQPKEATNATHRAGSTQAVLDHRGEHSVKGE